MQKTSYYSFKSGNLAKGCELCVKGQKLVFFITGLCRQNCFFCPVSEKKSQKDAIYANEWKIKFPEDLMEEARLTRAKGAGITGGDPLTKLNKTIYYIKLLKKTFGKKFHIHLYTPLILVNEKTLKKLYNSGLDEIRFHPNINNKKEWDRILLAKKFKWQVGIEIPVIPKMEKQTKQLIDFIKGNVDFLNLNELERSDSTVSKLDILGYKTKDSISYGIKGSEELAKKLLRYAEKNGIPTHYCTARLKDKVQLTNRIKRRAKTIATKFDKITKDGTLIRNAIYTNNPEKTKKLLKNLIQEKYLIEDKDRLITSKQILKKHKNKLKSLNLKPAIVEEYPTYDRMIVEMEFL